MRLQWFDTVSISRPRLGTLVVGPSRTRAALGVVVYAFAVVYSYVLAKDMGAILPWMFLMTAVLYNAYEPLRILLLSRPYVFDSKNGEIRSRGRHIMCFDDVSYVWFRTIRTEDTHPLARFRDEHHKPDDTHRVSLESLGSRSITVWESSSYQESLEVSDAIAEVLNVEVVCGPTGLVRERRD